MSEETKWYKCTRADGTDHRTGTISCAAALASGQPVEVLDAAPANGKVCGHGLHVSPTPRKTIQFADRNYRPWRYFEVAVPTEDIIESDDQKSRVRRLRVEKELFLADVFGPDFARRIEQVKTEAASWKEIPWVKPPRPVTDEELETLFRQWHTAITPWPRDGRQLPLAFKVVRTRKAAAAAAAAAAGAADAGAIYRTLPWWWRWYVRPSPVLYRHARWTLAGMTEPSPWASVVAMFRLGCVPIGYVRGEGDTFTVYAPGEE
jgi:hypothetical protein